VTHTTRLNIQLYSWIRWASVILLFWLRLAAYVWRDYSSAIISPIHLSLVGLNALLCDRLLLARLSPPRPDLTPHLGQFAFEYILAHRSFLLYLLQSQRCNAFQNVVRAPH
jgi:hypothetical protein